MRAADVAGLAGGALAGLASGELLRRLGRRGEVIGAGVGLVTAAAVYPVSRRSLGTGGLATETATLTAATALAGLATRLAPATGRRAVAGGWAAHALFDALQGPSHDSRLPRWYPALCAGYDLGLAGRLAV